MKRIKKPKITNDLDRFMTTHRRLCTVHLSIGDGSCSCGLVQGRDEVNTLRAIAGVNIPPEARLMRMILLFGFGYAFSLMIAYPFMFIPSPVRDQAARRKE